MILLTKTVLIILEPCSFSWHKEISIYFLLRDKPSFVSESAKSCSASSFINWSLRLRPAFCEIAKRWQLCYKVDNNQLTRHANNDALSPWRNWILVMDRNFSKLFPVMNCFVPQNSTLTSKGASMFKAMKTWCARILLTSNWNVSWGQ